MKIGDKLSKALNEQIREEFASAYLYLAMAAYFEDSDLPGIGAWMKVQAREELGHGMRIFDYLFEREGSVSLEAMEKPEGAWASPLAAFEAAYKHEQYITSCFDKLVKLARDEHDVATEQFLMWFVGEQVEEESAALSVVKQLKMVGGSPQGLYMVDHALGKRGAD